MNKTIRNLAIAALFVFPVLPGFPQAAQVQPVQALSVQQANPLAGLISMADAKRIDARTGAIVGGVRLNDAVRVAARVFRVLRRHHTSSYPSL